MIIRYYNVLFILADHQEGDKFKLEWLKERIENGDRMNMRELYQWCQAHEINYVTKFRYRMDYPVKANIWNLYSYLRAKVDYELFRWKKIGEIIGLCRALWLQPAGDKKTVPKWRNENSNKNWKNMDDRYNRGATSRQEIDKRFFCWLEKKIIK